MLLHVVDQNCLFLDMVVRAQGNGFPVVSALVWECLWKEMFDPILKKAGLTQQQADAIYLWCCID